MTLGIYSQPQCLQAQPHAQLHEDGEVLRKEESQKFWLTAVDAVVHGAGKSLLLTIVSITGRLAQNPLARVLEGGWVR